MQLRVEQKLGVQGKPSQLILIAVRERPFMARGMARGSIGVVIGAERVADLTAVEAAVLEEPRLASALLELRRPARAEALVADGDGDRGPIDSRLVQQLRSLLAVDAALGELGADPRGPLALRRTRTDEARGEACRRELAGLLERIERRRDQLIGEAARAELAFELATAVLAAGKENAREFLINNKDISADIEKQIRSRVLPGKAPVQVVEEEGAALQA